MENKMSIFESYLKNELHLQEKEIFEKSLQDDEILASEFRDFMIAKSAIKLASDARIKGKLDSIGQKKLADKRKLRLAMSVAASIIIVLGLSWLSFQYLSAPKTGEDLYAVYYTTPAIEKLTDRSVSADRADNLWNSSLIMYSAGDYEAALIPLLKLVNDTTIDITSKHLLTLGTCYMELGNYSQALGIFKQISKESSLVFNAQWSQVFCYIMINQEVEAIRVLDSIIAAEWHPKMKDAKKLQKELKHLVKTASTLP